MSDTTGDRADSSASKPPGLQQQIERGLEFAHIMLTVNQKQGSEAIASIQALVELLMRKGIIGQQELKEMIERMREEVAKAVAEGRFHLWTMTDVHDALELLTGLDPGRAGANGSYPAGSVMARVEASLLSFDALLREREMRDEG